jgi:hypothetical protein
MVSAAEPRHQTNVTLTNIIAVKQQFTLLPAFFTVSNNTSGDAHRTKFPCSSPSIQTNMPLLQASAHG